MNTKLRLLIALLCCNFLAYSQVDIALYKQFNGRYDFTFVGNTLNTETNKYNNTYIPPCIILTSSSASLALSTGDAIQAAYLYWAGSGTGDLSVKLNNTTITAQRVFDVSFASNGVTRPYFGAFADVTTLVQSTGTGNYTVSEFDLTSLINQNVDPALNTYCQNGTNFGGWVIVVVYKNDAIPFNQVNIYDGMEFVPDEVNITLNGLNIIDNVGAKTGFVAWEGDIALDDDETLTINNNTLSNVLNPPTNAFNSSNTVTGSSQLWNMDLDIYDVSNYVNIGDTSASIKLTSGADFVMINTIVTRLFSIAPDATVVVNGIAQTCDSRTITVNYTVHNDNATAPLPANTPVSIYLNGDYIGNVATQASIPIGGSESGTYTLTIPTDAPLDFQLIFIADDNGTGIGTVEEIDETNNSFTYTNSLWVSPVVPPPANLTACAVTDMTGTFNLTGYEQSLKQNETDVVTFYTTFEAAQLGTDFIQGTAAYDATANPQTIFVRVTDVHGCFGIASFQLVTVLCVDATIAINNVVQSCNSRTITINYTVNNIGDIPLPAGTPVSVYAGTTLLGTLTTSAAIAVGGSQQATVTLTIPAGVPLSFDLIFVVDDNGTGTGIVPEKYEDNNTATLPFMLWVSPVLAQPADVEGCETFNGSGIGVFNFSGYLESLKVNDTDVVAFYETEADALEGNGNTIPNPQSYEALDGTIVFVRLTDEHGCFTTGSFTLTIKDCFYPDATVTIDEVFKQCNSRIIHVHYTVSNLNGTDVLPAATPVSIYVNGTFLDYTETVNELAIGQSEEDYITLTIPIGIPLDFDLIFVADDTGDGTGVVVELNENNNAFTLPTSLVLSPVIVQPEDITACDKGFGLATFDFSAYAETLKNFDNEVVTFYLTQPLADQALEPIGNASSFTTTQNPQRIYVRLDNGTCHTTASFLLYTKKCAPVPYNYVTPNGDGKNDNFFVDGLRDIFLNFKMSIYNRYGNLVWTGNHSMPDWDGIADVAKVGSQNTTVPNGTYYFVLELNDPDYPEPIVGWVYVTM